MKENQYFNDIPIVCINVTRVCVFILHFAYFLGQTFLNRDLIVFAIFNIHSLRQTERVPIETCPSENVRFEDHNGDREVKIPRENRARRGEERK